MIIKKRKFSKEVLDKPVSPAYVYYTKYGDNYKELHKIMYNDKNENYDVLGK